MRHYSCDICGKDLIPDIDPRFIVRMESYLANFSCELTEADLDQDQVEAMAEILNELEESGEDTSLPTPERLKREFDLCSSCHCKFIGDPLGREQRNLHFSSN